MLQINIKNLIDDVQCYQTVRELRWPDGIACPSCQSKQVIKRGFVLEQVNAARGRVRLVQQPDLPAAPWHRRERIGERIASLAVLIRRHAVLEVHLKHVGHSCVLPVNLRHQTYI